MYTIIVTVKLYSRSVSVTSFTAATKEFADEAVETLREKLRYDQDEGLEARVICVRTAVGNEIV